MRAVRKTILLAGVLAAVLANLIVFGALSTTLGKPTPRPTRVPVAVKTFTPNPELLLRRVTPTATSTSTPTRYPTSLYSTETRVPHNQKGE